MTVPNHRNHRFSNTQTVEYLNVNGRPRISSFGVTDNEILLLYHCLGTYRSNYQFLAQVKTPNTGKLFDSLTREGVVTELCSGEFSVALP